MMNEKIVYKLISNLFFSKYDNRPEAVSGWFESKKNIDIEKINLIQDLNKKARNLIAAND